MNATPAPRDWLMICALVAMWGSSFVAIKFALGAAGPLWLAAIRLTLAAVLVTALAIPLRARWPRRREWPIVIGLGILGNSAPFALISWASLYVPSGAAGLMMATAPILVMLIAVIALPEEPVTPKRVFGLLVGFGGVALVIFGRRVPDGPSLAGGILPYVALLGGATGYAANTVLGRLSGAVPVYTRTLGAMVAAAVCSLVIAALFEAPPHGTDPAGFVALVYLAAGPTALAAIVLYRVLDRTSSGFVSLTNYLVPIASIAFGAILFSERLGLLQYAGVAVILAAVWLASGIRRRATPPGG